MKNNKSTPPLFWDNENIFHLELTHTKSVLIAVCIYRLVMISIELSETTQKTHWRGCNINPVATLPHAAVVFRMQPYTSIYSTHNQ